MGKTQWEKEKLLVFEQFLLFPQCFQKACIADMQKTGLVWERVKTPLIHSFITLKSQ